MVKITDGLGNQMFQYAYARMLQTQVSQKVYLDISDINNLHNEQAVKRGWTNLCDKRKYQMDQFMITLPTMRAEKYALKKDERYRKSKFLHYCKELRLLSPVYLNEKDCMEGGMKFVNYLDYYVEGSFFDKSYYENIKNILRREFQLKERLCIPDTVDKILKNRNTVSIHIRRGDFLKVGRDISETSYYVRAVDYMKNVVENPLLFVFSDDMEWVRNHIRFDLEYLLVEGFDFSDCEELTLMSMCKHNIIANSTFSYWGAWLNHNEGKIVIAPRGWRQKIIPNSWILL